MKQKVFAFRGVCLSLAVSGLFVSVDAVAQADRDLAEISLPPGFSIETWTDEVPTVCSIALGDKGMVYVATRRNGCVHAVMPSSDSAPTVLTIMEGMKMPNGAALSI